jgi:hypothetical protein
VNYTRFVVVSATPAECDPRIAAEGVDGAVDAARARRAGALPEL